MKPTAQLPLQPPIVEVDLAIDQIVGSRVLFPEKVKQAEEQIRRYGLPKLPIANKQVVTKED